NEVVNLFDSQIVIKVTAIQVFNSKYKNFYAEECEKLRKLQVKKGKLGKDQVQKSYNLNRQDLVIL
ncbi:3929_t:CDS:1, partial [Gigaspora margarita]